MILTVRVRQKNIAVHTTFAGEKDVDKKYSRYIFFRM